MTPLPNTPSQRTTRFRIAFVASFPSADDARIGRALSGGGGALLRGLLAAVGMSLDECFVGHVCQAPIGAFESVGWESVIAQEGIATLAADLAAWRPNIVVALDDPRLGSGVTHLLRAGNAVPPRTKAKGYAWPSPVSKWRGSLFAASTDVGAHPPERQDHGDGLDMTINRPFKAMATLHPAFVVSVGWRKLYELRCDLRRARDESTSSTLTLPALEIAYGPCDDASATTTTTPTPQQ